MDDKYKKTKRIFLTHRKFNYVITIMFIVVIILGLLITNIESGVPQANIKTFQDGLWWAFVSIATIGYGDHYPVTLQGRFIGLVLVFLGVIAFSLITAIIASWFVGEDEHKEYKKIHMRLHDLEKKIDILLKTKK